MVNERTKYNTGTWGTSSPRPYVSPEENETSGNVSTWLSIPEHQPNHPLCDLLDLSIAKINSAKFTINNPIAKINSAKLTVFGPANRENLFRENFCPRKLLPLRYIDVTFQSTKTAKFK